MTEPAPTDEAELEERLSLPTAGAIEVLRQRPGDLVVLGAGGKMGPTLARMARRALDARYRVIAVSRFHTPGLRERLEAAGVETRTADLLDRPTVARLPDAANLIFMAGQKFRTQDAPHVTWAMNAVVPIYAAERYARTPTVVFSTGNVYPLTPVASGGPTEGHPVGPVGEYAASCLARERIFEHAAATLGTPVTIMRLNYAVDLRYGVLVDVARRVLAGEPVPLEMGYVNLIWQGDANARALQCLSLAASPAAVLNVTGPETIAVRDLARQFGDYFGRKPVFRGMEAPDALLSNAAKSVALFGPPSVTIATMVEWTGAWLRRGGPLWEKPTHFEEREGRF
ncbi:MAG TPA: NAD(P)-dependent oxidoreductase [Gemmatimonadales bacterium]|jgi:nucleoside-diphosphate-sugar epimerase